MVGTPFAPPIFGASPAGQTSGAVRSGFGPTFYVNTVFGATLGNARSPKNAATTFAQVFDIMGDANANKAKSMDNAVIYWVGDVREQLTAPLGVSGVTIKAVQGGNNRHDNGDRWRTPASATAATPLLTLREQGWVIDGGAFIPDANATSCIMLRRQEDATYPDGSHAIIKNARFIGDVVTPVGIGIADYGGQSHVTIVNNEFEGLTSALIEVNASIAAMNRYEVNFNKFMRGTNDIAGNFYGSRFLSNTFDTPYHSSTHPIIINLSYTANESGRNIVQDNVFPDAITAIDDDHGYVESTGDVWGGNWASTSTSAASGAPWGGVPADS